MKRILVMLAVATIPAAAGCNCCGLGACPCNPCNWFNRGAACAPVTPTYAVPIAATACPPMTACPPTGVPAVMPQYAGPAAAPLATAPLMGAPMMADPTALGYMQPQPMVYSEPGCAYVEPGCAYPTAVGYGPSMPMSYGGCETGCCDTGSYDGSVITAPVEAYAEPTPTAD